MKEKKSNGTRNMTNINFAPKDFQRILSHLRFQKGIMKSSCSIKKAVLKHFAIFTGKHLCRSIL